MSINAAKVAPMLRTAAELALMVSDRPSASKAAASKAKIVWPRFYAPQAELGAFVVTHSNQQLFRVYELGPRRFMGSP